jgi:hypothetical protein
MTKPRFLPPLLPALLLLGCAGPPQMALLPQYEADLYPLTQTRAGVTVAIDEINPERTARYFGAELANKAILPVSVVVSNHGKQRVLVRPADILMYHGKEVIDPLPLESVLAAARGQQQFHLKSFFESMAFRQAAVPPGETYRGIVFFTAAPPRKPAERFLAVLSLYRESGPKVRVGLTNVDTSERLLFGPYALAGAEASRTAAY